MPKIVGETSFCCFTIIYTIGHKQEEKFVKTDVVWYTKFIENHLGLAETYVQLHHLLPPTNSKNVQHLTPKRKKSNFFRPTLMWAQKVRYLRWLDQKNDVVPWKNWGRTGRSVEGVRTRVRGAWRPWRSLGGLITLWWEKRHPWVKFRPFGRGGIRSRDNTCQSRLSVGEEDGGGGREDQRVRRVGTDRRVLWPGGD